MRNLLKTGIHQAWRQMWTPAAPFEPPEQEQAFLLDFAQQFAMHRRWAIVLALLVTLAYLGMDFLYSADDPAFAVHLNAVLWNRSLTATSILPALALSLTRRFEEDEHYASTVLVTALLVNFVFYCHGFLLVPYPYDYMYFFMGMFINMVCGFAMFRLRARPVLVVMVLFLVAAAITFAWNWHIKQGTLTTHAARIYQWVALSFLLTMALVGFMAANLLERTTRASFWRSGELAVANGALQSALDRIQQESAARARVLAAASHDLRQPLHALSIYSAVLTANASPTPQTLKEVGSNITQISRSLGALLHGLLDLSQLSSGHYVAAPRSVALHELLAGICAEFESAAMVKGIYLQRKLDAATVVCDSLAFARIARNLLDNAIKYTARGGVSIELVNDGSVAILTVADTGKGIASSEHSRIFEEFYQLDNQSRDRSQGVGLGLAIVQRLVELTGGQIAVESQLQQGSRFTVRIPVTQAVPPEPALPRLPGERFDGLSVYIVDDEPDILRSMSMLLQSWGCDVRTAAGVAETEALFETSGRPGLLIADLRLPDLETGFELAQRMARAHGAFPVIFATGETASEPLREVTDGGWPLLQKPIDADHLRLAMRGAAHDRPSRVVPATGIEPVSES